MRLFRSVSVLATLCAVPTAAQSAGNLAGQEPIVVTVELGRPGEHAFVPNRLRFETGKLYKLVLKNPSNDPHYFTSHGFSQMIFTRKGPGYSGARRQDRHPRRVQGRDPRGRGVSGALGGMVVRAGSGRAGH
jgi:hypothetical protein